MSNNTVCALRNEGFEDSDPVQVKEKGLKALGRINSVSIHRVTLSTCILFQIVLFYCDYSTIISTTVYVI